ncbi:MULTISPECIES: hypothetical protein [Saccharothrix]|uniref:hypothetical protein n=1 Tax=Saccharothrix TaxID=2071 RepID=UPI00093DEE8E|nr:hypothetical protein [Saccharothrix sp. CB00851]
MLTAAKTRRRAVAAALATCPPDKWVDVDSLFTAMRRGDLSPTIARTEMALWKLYLVDPEYGSLGYGGHHDWNSSKVATPWPCCSSTRARSG